MSRAGGMNDQGFGVAYVGQVADHPQCLDELLARRPAALDTETDDRPRAARQQLFCQSIIGMALQRGMQHPFDRLVGGEEAEHRISICDVPIHPDTKRLDALQELKSVEWRETGAEIAQSFSARAHDERGRSELLVENDAMISGIGLGQSRKFSGAAPIE